MSRPGRLHLLLAAGVLAIGAVVGAAAADLAPAPASPAPASSAPTLTAPTMAAPAPAAPTPAAPARVAPPPQFAPTAPAITGPLGQANKPSVSTRAPIRPTQVRNAPAPHPESRPTWAELTPQQQQALAPLAASWRSLGEAHKRKWLALSHNYHSLPAAEQARLQSRMAEWAALSPRQRTLARLNFAETEKVKPEDKRAKWEAYQRLSPEEKHRLAAGAVAAKPPPPGTALAVRPVPQQKLARIPKPRPTEAKIAGVPGARVDNNTLLPQPTALPQQP
jgi:hypothetical protein